MPTAYADRNALQFPPSCPHCGRRPTATRGIAAMSKFDMIVGEYSVPALINVPVCHEALQRRKVAGVSAFIVMLTVIFVGGFFATMLIIDNAKVPAAILGGAILLVALAGRTGWDDALLDLRLLGVCARGAGSSRVYLRFSRDKYFSEWSALNPSASASGGATGWRPPPAVAAAPQSIAFGRTVPAIAFVVLAGVIALHHWNATTGGEVFPVGSSLAMAFAFLAAGGVVYPPIFWSIGVYGKQLPWSVKAIGALLAIAGLTAGFLLSISYHHR